MVKLHVALPASIEDAADNQLTLDGDQDEPLLIFHAQDGVWIDIDAARNYYEGRLAPVYGLSPEQLIPWDQLNLAQQAEFASNHAIPASGIEDDDWRPDSDGIEEYLALSPTDDEDEYDN